MDITFPGPFIGQSFFIMLFATLDFDMGTTGFNTYFDFRRGTDSIEYTKESRVGLVSCLDDEPVSHSGGLHLHVCRIRIHGRSVSDLPNSFR